MKNITTLKSFYSKGQGVWGLLLLGMGLSCQFPLACLHLESEFHEGVQKYSFFFFKEFVEFKEATIYMR